jgi:hypothetical protein
MGPGPPMRSRASECSADREDKALARRALAGLAVLTAAGLGAMGLAGCGNTLQVQPIPHNELEGLLLTPYPVYWLGASFEGLQITEATRDPSGSFTIQYGNCLEGGQSTCVTPLTIVTSPDNGFVPGEGAHAGHAQVAIRGVAGYRGRRGASLSIPTAGVVIDIYGHTPLLARAAAARAVPINYPGAPGSPLAPPLSNTGYGERPLPSQIPNPLRALGL